ncbi:extracellular solute-binding protein [Alkalimarinus alittae]|uniref:Extracellular solute-binding protein n=1 Tax=Alkalimarinus alittae TaxID=2961619 RepID=A0ABY6N7A7_9ALTE|nr:extracellular solute-binding protein [Alkalimarinus alittae]UZE97877.1 extracellular solute-binding protein [Alkalimarinus alittae]
MTSMQHPSTTHSNALNAVITSIKLAGFSLFMSLSLASPTQAINSDSHQAVMKDTTPTTPKHGVAMHGDVKYPADFTHFDYVNPYAPKGGTVRRSVVSNSYDSFHPFVLKGVPAAGVSHYLYDTLTVQSEDEAFSQYGLIAEKIEMPADRSWVTFHINPKARFQDNHPILPEDVIFTFNSLIEHGAPFYKAYYGDVLNVSKTGQYQVRFDFKNNKNRELPLILGQLPVLPEHYWASRDFSKSTLETPLGSGPYKIDSFNTGRSISYKRNPNYWAKDLPVNKGLYNFDEIIFEYYGDQTIALEAFKAGEYDFIVENIAKNWATSYSGDKFNNGLIVKEEVEHEQPVGMQGFIFNTRKDIFKDPKVREALSYAFDFEWTNKQLFFGQYKRTNSYFENSELASSGLPSKEELAILNTFRGQIPDSVFTTVNQAPKTDGSGKVRKNLRTALKLLKEAGWTVKNKQLVNEKTSQPFKFEILLYQKSFERIIHPFTKNLSTLGIQADIRLVDTNQYIGRVREYDYDMFIMTLSQSNSPGNEQRDYWYSTNTTTPGTRNYIGVSDPVVDQLVDMIIAAPDRESLVTRTRVLDRILLSYHYVIPQWHLPKQRIAYWKRLSHPKVFPKAGVDFDTWWTNDQ